MDIKEFERILTLEERNIRNGFSNIREYMKLYKLDEKRASNSIYNTVSNMRNSLSNISDCPICSSSSPFSFGSSDFGKTIVPEFNDDTLDKESDTNEYEFTDDCIQVDDPGDFYAKPVIYIYSNTEMDAEVNLDYNGELTTLYPKFNNKDGWLVHIKPGSRLTLDNDNKEYNYLYWEGTPNHKYDLREGNCIEGKDTAEFLYNSLKTLGLKDNEINEFIVYWLPKMESNKYNIIAFQFGEYTDIAKLKINPLPEQIIRVFMTFKASNDYIEINKQTFDKVTRKDGVYTVVEWGGQEITR